MKHLLILLTAALTFSCGTNFIKSEKIRSQVDTRLSQRKEWLPAIPAAATPQEVQMLNFLYAYMPVGDAYDFSPELYLANVRSSLAAQKELGWQVPENLFLHYVLPIRVNNENLDTSRVTFFAELKERVKGKSMQDAILEVNHWCHEKAVYTPSDARTSAPSATVRSAAGRCGEESTFTTAALRAVGIPARQVYTPRWAHSDDNHAWVEAWADGKWYYIGACEPEPILNTGWFDAPAARAMLMHTKVFGDYTEGDEDVINSTESFTEINVTKNYTDTAPAEIIVVNADGSPAGGATVDFGIYNYAQFYAAARRTADENGRIKMSAGLGSLVVWANNGKDYGFAQLNFGKDEQVTVTLDNRAGSIPFDIVPPVEKSVSRDITPSQREANNKLLAIEDSIRTAYTSTFATQTSAEALAAELGADAEQVAKLLLGSKGNHGEITKFLKETPKEQLPIAFALLEVISAKDLRDTPAAVLRDHLSNAYQYRDEPFFKEYILNPRVGYELITAYRSRFAEIGGCSSAADLIATTSNVALVPELNPALLHITPVAVHDSRKADRPAMERYTIALLRSKGFAARLEPITQNLQYYDKAAQKWVNITTADVAPKGTLKLAFKGKDDPKYYTHFTIGKLRNGAFETIDLRSAVTTDMGAGMSYSTVFAKPLELEQGRYILTSGTRLANGSVLAQVEIFDIEAGKETVAELVMRQDDQKIKVIGEMNPESLFVKDGKVGSILSTTGRGYFIMALAGAKQEPTNHAMRDLAALKSYFEAWNRPIVLVFKDNEQFAKFDAKEFGALPSTVVTGYDNEGETAEMLKKMMKIENINNLPVFIIADTFGRVVFFSQGYQIGLGEQMKKVLDNLK